MRLAKRKSEHRWVVPILIASVFAVPFAWNYLRQAVSEYEARQFQARQERQQEFEDKQTALRSHRAAIERFFRAIENPKTDSGDRYLKTLADNLALASDEIQSTFQDDRQIIASWSERLDSDDRPYPAFDITQPPKAPEPPVINGPLRRLVLSSGNVNDDRLAMLSSHTSLEDLWLDHTVITDKGLDHLQALPNLKHLHLNGTAISSDGLIRIAAYPSLQTLYLSKRLSGTTGIDYLTTHRPNLRILFLD